MLSGLILAGGRSSRMDRDKAGITLADGRTLLQRQADVLREAGASCVIASLPRAIPEVPGLVVVHDRVTDAGPLAGIAAGLRAAPAGLVMMVAVDMPQLDARHLRHLVSLCTPSRGVVPVQNGCIEPLAAVYPAGLAASAEDELGLETRAVHLWVKRLAREGHLQLWPAPPDWSDALRSWNSPEDLPA